MAIYKLLENAAFDPAKVALMIEAYECACRELELAGSRTDRLTELVAKKVVEIAQQELDVDAKFICQRSLRELGFTTH